MRLRTSFRLTPDSRQRGFSLLVSLAFLVILTLLGIGAMKMSATQERVAGNAMDRAVAFEAAERALREAEGLLIGANPYSFDTGCTSGLCSAGAAPAFSDDTLWGGTKDVAATTVPDAAHDANSVLAASPRWRAEFAGQLKCPTCSGGWSPAYRITARANGKNTDTRVFLQSVYTQQ